MTEQQAPERFTKKPVTITAIQWTGDNLKAVLDFTGKHHKWADWFADFAAYEAHVKADGNVFKIFTLEGVMDALPGDWIIRGVQGEHYPCKPGIFSATYSPADLTPPSDQSATIARLTAELEQMTAIKDIHQRKRVEYCDRAEAAEVALAEIMAERDDWKDEYKTAEKGLNVYRKANVKVIAERDAARAKGFAQGIEAAAKWVKDGYKCQTCGKRFLASDNHEVSECSSGYPSWERIELDELVDTIAALSVAPPVDVNETPVHERQAGLSLTDDTQTTQVDPVREVAEAVYSRLRTAQQTGSLNYGAGVYIASKTKYASEWIAVRDSGYPIISTWIDEAGEGETGNWPDLWSRCVFEASSAKSLVVICRDGDTLKGAWVEVGAALGAGKTVFAAGCDSFTIRHHPRFVVCASEAEAFARATLAQKGE